MPKWLLYLFAVSCTVSTLDAVSRNWNKLSTAWYDLTLKWKSR